VDIIENSKLIAFIGVLKRKKKVEKCGRRRGNRDITYVENMTFPPIPHKGPGAEFRPSSMHKEGRQIVAWLYFGTIKSVYPQRVRQNTKGHERLGSIWMRPARRNSSKMEADFIAMIQCDGTEELFDKC